ncbi:DUF192 domain-containing protein [Brevibacillus dissolubilis]|uniref:DUF192 domain-containing protein n=1 Tax=Brevibacillus dissolubilis TaxID=1844116 RepID=UPI001115DEC3|nr:DUF192 domain-containing protein [Brevibacillus dissolubilis]
MCFQVKYFDYFNRFHTRLLGLMGRASYPKERMAVLVPCQQVHTFFMRFDIVVIYLDAQLRVLWIGVLPPWRIGPYFKQAHVVLESTDMDLLDRIAIGDKVQLASCSTMVE